LVKEQDIALTDLATANGDLAAAKDYIRHLESQLHQTKYN